MSSPPTAPLRLALPTVALGLSIAASAGLVAVAPRTFVTLRPCVPGSLMPLAVDAGSVPLGLAHHAGALYALLSHGAHPSFAVDLYRLDGSVATRIATRTAPALNAVSGLVVGPRGPLFAIARGASLTVTALDGTALHDTEFPRAEQPEGRAELTPAVALATEPDGTPTALLAWPGRYGTRRLHARDVRESPPYTPARNDTFGAQDLVLLGDRAVIVQEHREGTFTRPPEGRVSIEVVSVPVSPFHIERPKSLRLTDAPVGAAPHITPIPSPGASAEALVSYAAGRTLELVHLAPTPSGWRVVVRHRAPEAVPTGVLASDLGTAAGAFNAVFAWRTADALLVRAMDARTGRLGPVASLPSPVGTHPARVTFVRAGSLSLLASHSAQGPSVHSVFVDPDGSIDLRPIALPATPDFTAGARVAGFAADDTRAVLAVTRASIDAPSTPLSFATIAPTTGLATALPAPETIPSSVRDLGLLSAPVAVVVGVSARGLRLQRVGDAADDGEAGEDLLLRGSRAAEFVLASSPSLHRVWVADTAGPEPSDFGPSNSVVLYSAIDTLEDGPRTEMRMGTVPYATFGRVTLDPVTLTSRPGAASAWASSWSSSTDPDCIPGASIALTHTADDRPLQRLAQSPSEPFAYAVSLIPARTARCGDRVGAIVWSGDRFAATVAGETVGERLAFGSVDSGVPSLDVPSVGEASLRSLSVARMGIGVVAAWVSGSADEARLRYRLFRMNGASRSTAGTLAHIEHAPRRPLALSVSGDELAALVASPTGVSIVRAQCRLP